MDLTRHGRVSIVALSAVGVAVLVIGGIRTVSARGSGPAPAPGATSLDEPLVSRVGPAVSEQPRHPVVDITLPTGDRVRLATLPDGRQAVSPLPTAATHPNSRSAGFTKFVLAGDTYVIPVAVLRSLASTLDLGMFDVSYLARAGLADGASATLPLVATLSPKAAVPAIPGLQVTGTGAERHMRIQKSEAWRLGRALESGQISGIHRLALPAPQRAVKAPPTSDGTTFTNGGGGIPQRTLTVNVLDRTGQPGLAIAFVQNVDSLQRYLALAVVNGSASFSVPEGSYMIAANILRFHDDGVNFDSAFVSRPQLDVRSSRTSVTLDARTALPLQVTVPGQQTSPSVAAIAFDRASADGGVLDFSGFSAATAGGVAPGDSRLFATPTEPVTKGSFGFEAFFELTQGATYDPDATHYYLDFPNAAGVPATLTHTVQPSALTRAENTYYWPDLPAGGCGSSTGPVTGQGLSVAEPWSISFTGFFDFLSGPQARTDYLYSPPSSLWYNVVQSPACQFFVNAGRHLAPGGNYREDWFKAPMHPGIQRAAVPPGSVASEDPFSCPACRQDDNLFAQIRTWGNFDPGHVATQEGGTVTTTTRFYQDGKLAMTTLLPFVDFPLRPTPASYRIDWHYVKDAPGVWPLSNDVTTSWTFHSAPTRGQHLPAGEHCLPDPTVGCAMLPLLFVDYDLPLALNDSAPAPGDEPVTLHVGRQANMSPPRSVSVSLSYSFDDGATWTAAPAARPAGEGRFTTVITQPDPAATSGYVSLRVHAADADGNSIDQTILRAYRLS